MSVSIIGTAAAYSLLMAAQHMYIWLHCLILFLVIASLYKHDGKTIGRSVVEDIISFVRNTTLFTNGIALDVCVYSCSILYYCGLHKIYY